MEGSKDEETLNDAEITLITKLEDFCSSGEFTSWVSEFQSEHAHHFTDEEDQPIQCYAIF
jgi:hypothetical protein